MVALTGEQMGNVPVLECAMVEGRIVLSWPKVMKGYVLEVCEGLGGEWNEAAEFVSENGELWEAQVAMEGSWRFYRLRKINE
jgi:hypothetical protein